MNTFSVIAGSLAAALVFYGSRQKDLRILSGGVALLAAAVLMALPVRSAPSPEALATTAPIDSYTFRESVSDDASPAPTPTPAPLSKKDFLALVNERISIASITSNKLRYVGENVDLHGTVVHIIDETTFVLADSAFNGVTIDLVDGQTVKNLSEGQALRVIGTVQEPQSGINAFGANTTFAAVEAHFME